MGGGGSKPSEFTITEDQPPAGSEESSMVYPDRPGMPRLDGISRSLANECNNCSLQVVSGISSSSVKISREFGSISYKQCTRYKNDLKDVREKKLSFQDFLNNLQSGVYFRDLNNGYCEKVELSSEDATKMTKIEDYDEGKLRSVRILQSTSGGFSADTKVKITPSIPFQMRVSAAGEGPIDVPIQTMTLYHPCPIRIEGVQPDAVLSLNDPSFGKPKYVILVPLTAKNTQSPSIGFLQKLLPEAIAVSQPDPSTGQYIPKDVPTGQNWKLSQLFDVIVAENGKDFDVKTGMYVWKGMPSLKRTQESTSTGVRFKWLPSGDPSPQYILMDTPVACNPGDLAILTSRIPITRPSDAIHAILYDDNPMQRGIVHKQGPPENCFATEAKESFTDLQGVYSLTGTSTQEEEACDAWTLWAKATAGKGFTNQQIASVIFNVLVFIAMAVGTYVAFSAVLRLYDVEYSEVAKNIGKLSAVFARNLQQKAAALKSNLSSISLPGGIGLGALRNPAAALKGAQANALSGLQDSVKGQAAALSGLQGQASALSGLQDQANALSGLQDAQASVALPSLAEIKTTAAIPTPTANPLRKLSRRG